MRRNSALARALRLAVVMVALGSTACELMPIFQDRPPDPCNPGATRRGELCGPCLAGVELFHCGNDRRWQLDRVCEPSPYDVDGDGFANQLCFDNEVNDSCCGVADCDDSVAERFPGSLADIDDDGWYDDRCCDLTDDERCADCNDDDPHRWYGHADLDGDGHHDVICGGDDCDDTDELRWIGNADIDGDGHVDARCCTLETPLCDDCDDGDPQRWGGHADLDGDGHDSVGCGGDDCDDMHPQRWIGHADVDGDGRQDDRCCLEASNVECNDCNDNDPWRWTGNTDVDGDGHNDAQCRCDADELGVLHCDTFDDCDDDCAECAPGQVSSNGSARDHDCNGVVDDVEVEGLDEHQHGIPTLVAEVDTGDSLSVAVVGSRAFVGTETSLYEVDTSVPANPEIVSFVSTGAVRDVAVWRDLVLAATDEGLVVVRRVRPGEGTPQLDLLARLEETGQSRGVFISLGYAFVAAYEALFVVDLSMPASPAIISSMGEPLIHDVRDVVVGGVYYMDITVAVLSGSTRDHPNTGGLTMMDLSNVIDDEPPTPVWAFSHIEISEGRRVERQCGDNGFYVVISESGVNLVTGGAVYLDYPVPSGSRSNGGFVTCTATYVAGDDGLHWLFGASDFNGNDSVDTGLSHAVAVSGEHIFVATAEGLKILEL